ncbi:MAG TPA: hypothetical protein VK158_06585 [Acidobacteriota bacterium]|nr:hypothetical protein [Acidobacteriota bacterium]
MFFFISFNTPAGGFADFNQQEYEDAFRRSFKHIQMDYHIDNAWIMDVFINEYGRISHNLRFARKYGRMTGEYLGIAFGGLIGFCHSMTKPQVTLTCSDTMIDAAMEALRIEIRATKSLGFPTADLKEQVFELHRAIPDAQVKKRKIVSEILKML